MSRELNKDAVKAIHDYYSCQGRKIPFGKYKYPCIVFDYCKFGKGSNNSYDCCDCGADEFYEGYIRAIKDKEETK